MAETSTSPNNARVRFRGKPEKEPMAKSKPTEGSAIASPSAESDRDWEAESAFRTMKEAEQHQANPDMMKRVVKHAKKESGALNSVMSKLRARGLVSDKQAEKAEKKRAGAK